MPTAFRKNVQGILNSMRHYLSAKYVERAMSVEHRSEKPRPHSLARGCTGSPHSYFGEEHVEESTGG